MHYINFIFIFIKIISLYTNIKDILLKDFNLYYFILINCKSYLNYIRKKYKLHFFKKYYYIQK